MSFPLYFDEDQNERIANRLKADGYDILTTKDAGRAHQRLSDEHQLAFATSQNRAIVTNNAVDFYALASEWAKDGREHSGIIVVSPRRTPSEIREGIQRLQELYPNGIQNYCLVI